MYINLAIEGYFSNLIRATRHVCDFIQVRITHKLKIRLNFDRNVAHFLFMGSQ